MKKLSRFWILICLNSKKLIFVELELEPVKIKLENSNLNSNKIRSISQPWLQAVFFLKVLFREPLNNFERPPIFKFANGTAVQLFQRKFTDLGDRWTILRDHFGSSKRLKKHWLQV